MKNNNPHTQNSGWPAQIVPLFIGILVGVLAYFSISYFISKKVRDYESYRMEVVNSRLERTVATIEREIDNKLYLAKNLASYVSYNPNLSSYQFQQFAKEVYKLDSAGIFGVQLVKDSIILYTYPERSNEEISGTNILSLRDDRHYIDSAYSNQKPMLIGPRQLLQQQMGVVYRYPIILDVTADSSESFWGYSAIVLSIEPLIKRLYWADDLEGVALYSDNPTMDNPGFFLGDTVAGKSYCNKAIHLPAGKWLIYTSIENEVEAVKEYRYDFLPFQLLLSSLVGIGFWIMAKLFYRIRLLNFLLKKRQTVINQQLEEKTILFNEIHHRVKNHCQLLISLNNYRYAHRENQEIEDIVQEINNRVNSISIAYEQLKYDKSCKVPANEYILQLCENLSSNSPAEVTIDYKISEKKLNMKILVTLGIILNEMLMNSLKYAFDNDEGNIINIELQKAEEKWILIYMDNGGKLNQSIVEKSHESSGIELIKLFVNQLEGKIQYYSQADKRGYKITFTAP
jgi:two-component sensor histidine kinase